MHWWTAHHKKTILQYINSMIIAVAIVRSAKQVAESNAPRLCRPRTPTYLQARRWLRLVHFQRERWWSPTTPCWLPPRTPVLSHRKMQIIAIAGRPAQEAPLVMAGNGGHTMKARRLDWYLATAMSSVTAIGYAAYWWSKTGTFLGQSKKRRRPPKRDLELESRGLQGVSLFFIRCRKYRWVYHVKVGKGR